MFIHLYCIVSVVVPRPELSGRFLDPKPAADRGTILGVPKIGLYGYMKGTLYLGNVPYLYVLRYETGPALGLEM